MVGFINFLQYLNKYKFNLFYVCYCVYLHDFEGCVFILNKIKNIYFILNNCVVYWSVF